MKTFNKSDRPKIGGVDWWKIQFVAGRKYTGAETSPGEWWTSGIFACFVHECHYYDISVFSVMNLIFLS